jgi:hypothetical protein
MTDRVWKFSRSHDQCYVDCGRKAYYTYYYNGTGIVRKGLDLYQETGSLTHAILRGVMLYAKTVGTVPPADVMDEICGDSIKAYRELIQERGFNELSGELELEMARQQALAEGLARAWTATRLPYYLENFNIVAVEEEHEVPFGPGQILMSRLDGVIERKSDQELFAGPEFKTTGWISDDYIESWRYSTQTLSHSLDVEAKYGKTPAGVMMEFLYKGMKKKGEDGSYTYYSPLVRAFKMQDNMTGQEIYGYDSALGRKKDWKVFEPYTMGMGKWIEMLPQEVLESMCYNTTVYRSDREVKEWKLTTMLRQGRIQAGLIMLNEEEPTKEAADEIMAAVFPARLDQFCFSDQYRKKCPFLDVCYGTIDDPLQSDVFTAREPHHPSEFEVADE